eukprot:scaffold322846_cov19-Tisochrysis_lutea.AAC.1
MVLTGEVDDSTKYAIQICINTACNTQLCHEKSRQIQHHTSSSHCTPACKQTAPTPFAAQYAFAFAAVWGIGGNMNSGSWDKWDPFVRDLFEGTANYPGGSGTVFDYYQDPKKNYSFSHWDDLVPNFVYQPALPYFQILVPTTDTTRYAFLLKTCLESRYDLIMCCACKYTVCTVSRGTDAARIKHHPSCPAIWKGGCTSVTLYEPRHRVEHSVLFTGASGTGKTAVFLDTLSRMADDQFGTVDTDDGKDANSLGASTGVFSAGVTLAPRLLSASLHSRIRALHTRNAASETNLSIVPEKPSKTVMPVVINFSAQTSSAATQ